MMCVIERPFFGYRTTVFSLYKYTVVFGAKNAKLYTERSEIGCKSLIFQEKIKHLCEKSLDAILAPCFAFPDSALTPCGIDQGKAARTF